MNASTVDETCGWCGWPHADAHDCGCAPCRYCGTYHEDRR